MYVEVGCFVDEAEQDARGLWCITGIQDYFQVRDLPADLVGATFFSKLFFTVDELNVKPSIDVHWRTPHGKEYALIRGYFPEVVRLRGGGGTAGVRLKIGKLPCEVPGLYQVGTYFNGVISHVSTIDIYKEFVDLGI